MEIKIKDLPLCSRINIDDKYDNNFFDNYDLIIIIPKINYKKQRNQIFVSSILRYTTLDTKRCDSNEGNMKYIFRNTKKEKYSIHDNDLEIIGIKPTEKFTGITDTGGITFSQKHISNERNFYSMSFSYVPKDKNRNNVIKEIADNLNFNLEDNIVLKLRKPVKFFQDVCKKLKDKDNVERFIALYSMIKYQDRERTYNNLNKFMEELQNLQSNIDLDVLFTKPMLFKKDLEIRVIWIPTNNNMINTDICNESVLLNMPCRSYFKIEDLAFKKS